MLRSWMTALLASIEMTDRTEDLSCRWSMSLDTLCRLNKIDTCGSVYTLMSLKLVCEACNSPQPALNLTSISNQSHRPTNLHKIAQNDLDDLQTDTAKHEDNESARQGYKISQSICRQTRQMPPPSTSTCKMQAPTSPAKRTQA